MKPILSSTFLMLTLFCAIVSEAEEKKSDAKGMRVLTPASMQSSPGLNETFTGSVKVTMLVEGEEPSNLNSASVIFQPGARSAWHTHPKGQLLVVTEGSGLIQEKGNAIRRIQKGDVVWTPPNVKHWHGATSDSAMTHIATQESLDGKPVEWMEKVTEGEYGSAP